MSNLFLIKVNRKHGYMDDEGRIVIQPKFTWAGDFNERYAIVGHPDPEGRKDRFTGGIQSLWGYIDGKGNPITPVHFHVARPFSGGFAGVYLGKKFGYINTRGEYSIEPRFDAGFEFSEGLATVVTGKNRFAIDSQGKIVSRSRRRIWEHVKKD